MLINTPISIGELVDKISILEIKREKVKNETKLKNVEYEYETLHRIFQKEHIRLTTDKQKQLDQAFSRLREVNNIIWIIEDDIRECEMHKDFGEKFIGLARGVYYNNDERARIKREINQLVDSKIIEEKSYADYK